MDLQTAADRLGVHYQTAYRWVRDGSLRAAKRGSSYEIDDAEIVRFQEMRLTPVAPPKKANVRSWHHQVERLYAHLLQGDELGARQLVDRLHEGMIEVLVICEELLAPTLSRLGDAWERAEVSIAEEHRASSICERLVARLGTHPRGRPRGVCLVATPEGEEHSLPAAMAAIVLRADRWQVHHLGTQVPAPDLAAMTRSLSASLVVLSITTTSAMDHADQAADQVRAGTEAHVMVGGPGTPLSELVARARAIASS